MNIFKRRESNTSLPVADILPEKKSKRKIIIALITLLSLGTIIGGIFYYSYKVKKNNTAQTEIPKLTEGISTKESEPNEVSQIVKDVGKIMILPDETPILATVTDLEKVKNQIFFEKATLGDKVLIFMQAKKAILYRPKDKIIVEVGRVNDQMPKGDVAGENITVPETTPIPETTGFLPKVSPTIPPTVPVTPTPTGFDFSTEY